jgi:hypothetical protein
MGTLNIYKIKNLVLVIKHFIDSEQIVIVCEDQTHLPADLLSRWSCGVASGNCQQ